LYRWAAVVIAVASLHAQATRVERPSRLPSWLKLGGELRGRWEGATSQDFLDGADDAYYLHRVRLNLTLTPRPWLRVFAQAQDSHAPGHRAPAPATAVNTLDLRQGYVEIRGPGRRFWGVRAGRQEMAFGAERLVGYGNWGNVSRSFDGVRAFRETEAVRLDWFATALVIVNKDAFDRPHRTVQLHGFHGGWKSWIPKATVETYLFHKHERGVEIATPGARVAGELPRGFDYTAEAAFQAGKVQGESHRAWAASVNTGHTAAGAPWSPRVYGIYSHASGDTKPSDRRRRTFDNLYPTNHQHYGLVDRVGWRNMHEAAGGVQWKPSAAWRLTTAYHSFWLATRGDFFYRENGTPLVRNPEAASSHIGQEVDAFAVWTATSRMQLFFGLSHLFAGGFLRESGRGFGAMAPYVMWRFSLD
jgi:hypothetical protein